MHRDNRHSARSWGWSNLTKGRDNRLHARRPQEERSAQKRERTTTGYIKETTEQTN